MNICPKCGQKAHDADGDFYCDCGHIWRPDYSTDKLPDDPSRKIIYIMLVKED